VDRPKRRLGVEQLERLVATVVQEKHAVGPVVDQLDATGGDPVDAASVVENVEGEGGLVKPSESAHARRLALAQAFDVEVFGDIGERFLGGVEAIQRQQAREFLVVVVQCDEFFSSSKKK
jgi:hypothetical protein